MHRKYVGFNNYREFWMYWKNNGGRMTKEFGNVIGLFWWFLKDCKRCMLASSQRGLLKLSARSSKFSLFDS
jgi:hypothetical protein